MSTADIIDFLTQFIRILFEILSFLIIIRVLMSWFRTGGPHGSITRFIVEVTEPVMEIARRITPRVGMFDFSPIVAILGLNLIERLILFILTGS